MNKFAQALAAALDRCIVTNTVAEQGEPVGFLYREAPYLKMTAAGVFSAATKPTNTPTIPTTSALSVSPPLPQTIPTLRPC